jgi:hypothetical protein
MGSEITGFFIAFTEEESKDIMRRLDLFGYTQDGEGLKQLVIDTLCNLENGNKDDEEFESPTDSFIRTATGYIKENPDKILMGINAIKGLGTMLRRGKK